MIVSNDPEELRHCFAGRRVGGAAACVSSHDLVKYPDLCAIFDQSLIDIEICKNAVLDVVFWKSIPTKECSLVMKSVVEPKRNPGGWPKFFIVDGYAKGEGYVVLH